MKICILSRGASHSHSLPSLILHTRYLLSSLSATSQRLAARRLAWGLEPGLRPYRLNLALPALARGQRLRGLLALSVRTIPLM